MGGPPGRHRTLFTETMTGWFAPFSGQAYAVAEACGRASEVGGYFILTVVSDVGAMVLDPDRRSPAFGCVVLPVVDADPLRVVDGQLDLFVDAGPRCVEMRYRLLLQTRAGEVWCLRGVKEVNRRCWFPTVLADTTTLFVDVFRGEAPVGDPAFRGILRMGPAAVAAQGLSFRGEGGPLGLGAIVRFARYYISRVAAIYFGPRTPPRIPR